jgi:hypothetical protein
LKLTGRARSRNARGRFGLKRETFKPYYAVCESIWKTLFWADPLKAFIAFGFSHAIEYSTLVWAFQRRRYRRLQAKPYLMQRLLQHSKIWYALL